MHCNIEKTVAAMKNIYCNNKRMCTIILKNIDCNIEKTYIATSKKHIP
jgi:hypothetical protein